MTKPKPVTLDETLAKIPDRDTRQALIRLHNQLQQSINRDRAARAKIEATMPGTRH